MLHGVVRLDASQGRLRARLFELGAVLSEEASERGGWSLELRMPERDLRRFIKREKLEADILEPLPMQASAAAATWK